jgi:hypothetical protein
MGIFFHDGKTWASVTHQGAEPITSEILAEVETSLLKQMEQLQAKLSPKDASTEKNAGTEAKDDARV